MPKKNAQFKYKLNNITSIISIIIFIIMSFFVAVFVVKQPNFYGVFTKKTVTVFNGYNLYLTCLKKTEFDNLLNADKEILISNSATYFYTFNNTKYVVVNSFFTKDFAVNVVNKNIERFPLEVITYQVKDKVVKSEKLDNNCLTILKGIYDKVFSVLKEFYSLIFKFANGEIDTLTARLDLSNLLGSIDDYMSKNQTLNYNQNEIQFAEFYFAHLYDTLYQLKNESLNLSSMLNCFISLNFMLNSL